MVKADDFGVEQWVDGNGQKISPLHLADFGNKMKVIFCFQSWCPGCHSIGFPSLIQLTNSFSNMMDSIVFLAIQTVFEGFNENTFESMLDAQKKYNLKIPFGHDAGNNGFSTSNFMKIYQTGGTPWFVIIDRYDNVVFSDFHININGAVQYLYEEISK